MTTLYCGCGADRDALTDDAHADDCPLRPSAVVSLLGPADQLPIGSLSAVEAHLRDLLDAPEGRVLLTRYRCAVSPDAIRELIATYLARGLLGLPTALPAVRP